MVSAPSGRGSSVLDYVVSTMYAYVDICSTPVGEKGHSQVVICVEALVLVG